MLGRRVEVVERAGDEQVGVGVEVLGELVALVPQVRLDLEIDVEVELDRVGAERAAEFLHHRVVGQVGDVPDHAREAQAAARHHAVPVVVAAVEIRVGGDRLARDLVERDVLRRELGRRRDHDRVADAVRVADRPLQRLHRAQAPAHHGGEGGDAQAVGEPRLRVHPVLDRDHGEGGAVGLAGRGVRRSWGRSCRSSRRRCSRRRRRTSRCRAACPARSCCPTSRRCRAASA